MSVPGTNGPFKGLASFEDSDSDARLFFGREREREIIVANLLASRLTVLYGESGVGKSSVLCAGVARDLRALPEPMTVVVFADWRDDPARALESRIAEATGAEAQGRLADTLELGAGLAGGEVFVILDGLEEESLYHGPDIGPGSFLDEFSEAATRPGIRASFLLAVREDSLAKLDRFKSRVPNVFGNYLRLERLDRVAGREAILGPVDRYNQTSTNGSVNVEPALVEAVLDQVAAGKVELGGTGRGARANGAPSGIEAPFLQLVMARLWAAEAQQSSVVLRLETFEQLGGAEQIVSDHLEQALASLDHEQQDVAAAVFNHLVTPSGTKIAHDASDLAGYLGTRSQQLEQVLALLATQRILRPVPGVGGSELPRYEIYHDILADAVLAWRTRHESEREVERVREAAARRHRRLLVIAVAAVLLAGAMAGTTVFAFSQRSEAQKQAERARRANDAVSGKNAQLRRANNTVNQKNAQLRRANNTVNQQNGQLRDKNAQLNQANNTVNQQNAQLKDKNAQLNQANNTVNQKNAQLKQTNAQLNHANNTVNQKNAQLKQTNAQLNHANNTVNQKNAELHSSNTQLSVATKRAEQKTKEATAGELGATALTELSTAPEQALTEALKSAQLVPSGAESVLRSALLSSRAQAILPVDGAATTAAVSPGVSTPATRGFRTTAVSASESVLAVGDPSELRLYRVPSGRLIRTLKVGAKVAAVAFSPDGKLVATASPTGYVDVWDVASGQRVQQLSHGGRPVRDISFSHDGKLLATASNDKRARIWEVSTGRLSVSPIVHPRAVSLVAFSPDDHLLLTVDGVSARLIDVASGRIVRTMTQQDSIRTAAFRPDGTLVATGGSGTRATAHLWTVPDGTSVGGALTGHGGDILSVSFSRDGKLLLTASADDTARVWKVPDGNLVANLVAHGNQVRTASFSPDSKWIVTASKDGTARVWETATGFPRFLLAGHRKPLTAAFFTPDGRSVVTASEDGTARIWDPGTNPELQQFGRHSAAVAKVSVSPDGRLALSAGGDGTVRLWPVGGGPSRILQLGGQVTTALWSRDGKLVLAGNDAGIARAWRAVDGRVVATLRHGAPIRAAAFSPDETRIVTAGADGVARIWRTAGGLELENLEHGGVVNAASFSPDGVLVATAGDDGLARLWATDTGRLVRILRGHTKAIVALAFSPDGNWLATASADKTARIWDVHGGPQSSPRAVLRHADAVTSLAFSPDGTRLVTASFDHDAIVWSVPDGTRLRVLSGHSGVVSDVAFSYDGRWIVTAGPTTAGLWQADASAGSPPFMYLHGSGAQLTSVAFSPEGWRVVTGSKDGTVATYECRLCGGVPQLIGMAKARLADLGRDLTPEQRKRYLGG